MTTAVTNVEREPTIDITNLAAADKSVEKQSKTPIPVIKNTQTKFAAKKLNLPA